MGEGCGGRVRARDIRAVYRILSHRLADKCALFFSECSASALGSFRDSRLNAQLSANLWDKGLGFQKSRVVMTLAVKEVCNIEYYCIEIFNSFEAICIVLRVWI